MNKVILIGNVLDNIPKIKQKCRVIITSPPYYKQRKYGDSEEEIGNESTVEEYIEKLTIVFSQLRDILTDDGSLWIIIGDVRKGNVKLNIPHTLVQSLEKVGYYFREDVIWHKPNSISGSSKNNLSQTYELILFFSKNRSSFTNMDAIRIPGNEVISGVNQKPPDYLIQHSSSKPNKEKILQIKKIIHNANSETPTSELPSTSIISQAYGYDPEKFCPTCYRKMKRHATRRRFGGHKHYPIFAVCNSKGKNPGNVWSIGTTAHKGNEHFAIFPERLVENIINFASESSDWVLDPFMGRGTTAIVSDKLQRNFIGIELYELFLKKIFPEKTQIRLPR